MVSSKKKIRVRKSLEKPRKLQYPEKAMIAAIKDVNEGMPVATAAKKHCVPRPTLRDKVKGRTPVGRKMGPPSILSEKEEEGLVQWIKLMAARGFPISTTQLMTSVEHAVGTMKRQNPFKNGKPGRKWLKAFLRRNPGVSVRTSENLTTSRANVSTEKTRGWFQEIENYLQKNALFDVLKDPTRVFNGDETGFFLSPNGQKVLAARGSKSVYLTANSNEKECLTVLVTANAAGALAPPMVVFSYDRIPSDIAASVPDDWGMGKSQNGWMTRATFYEYFTTIFEPWLVAKNIPRPIIFFVDGHSSHLNYHLSDFCVRKQIILVALPPNTTHFMQPMDVSVFSALKIAWKSAVHDWRLKNISSPTLTKRHFCPLLKDVLKTIKPSSVANGFKKCGLVPWDFSSIEFKENTEPSTPTYITTCGEKTNRLSELERAIAILESYIGVEKLLQFKMSSSWLGEATDSALYQVWRKMKNDLEKDNTEKPLSSEEFQAGHSIPEVSHEVRAVIPLPSEEPQAEIHSVPEMTHEERADDPTPTSATARIQAMLPSPFKNSLIWPEEIVKPTTRRKREVLPSVVSSSAYRDYLMKKEGKKRDEERKKRERALAREEKKKDKERLKKQKSEESTKKRNKKGTAKKKKKPISSSESDEEWQPSESDGSDPDEPHGSDQEMATDSVEHREDGHLDSIVIHSEDVPEEIVVENVGLYEEIENVELDEDNNYLHPSYLADSIINDIRATLNLSSHEATINEENNEGQEEMALAEMSGQTEVTLSKIGTSDQRMEAGNKVCPISKGDFAIISVRVNNVLKKKVCKIEETDAEGSIAATSLLPYNRLKTVFTFSGEKVFAQINDIITKIDTPMPIGRNRVCFSSTIQVD